MFLWLKARGEVEGQDLHSVCGISVIVPSRPHQTIVPLCSRLSFRVRKTWRQLERAADCSFFVRETRNALKRPRQKVFLTVGIHQSCRSRRVQSIPGGESSASFLPSVLVHPPPPLSSRIPQFIACISLFVFSFGAIVSVLSLNLSSFLHCTL